MNLPAAFITEAVQITLLYLVDVHLIFGDPVQFARSEPQTNLGLMTEIDSYLAGMPCLRTIKLYFRTKLRTPEPDTKDLVGRIRKQLLMFYESGVAVQFSLSPENVVVEFGSEDY